MNAKESNVISMNEKIESNNTRALCNMLIRHLKNEALISIPRPLNNLIK
jgi:hypothetical protein